MTLGFSRRAPHEAAEGAELYPVLDRVLGGSESTVTMSRAHAEIARLIRRLGRVLDDLDPEHPDEADVLELRPLLYGLHAVLRLHVAQEEEEYFSLLDDPVEAVTRSSIDAEHVQGAC